MPVERASEDPPVIQLIDIERMSNRRVCQIVHLTARLPEPVRLEALAVQRCAGLPAKWNCGYKKLMAKRSTATNKQTSI